MSNINLDRDKKLSIFSIVIIVAAYAIERLIEIFCGETKTLALAMAAVMTLLVAIVYFILSKNKNPFFGLLATLIGYKMMPPSISMLKTESLYGEALYYIVTMVAIILFVFLTIKFYRMQTGDSKIMVLPILAIMVSVNFFSQIADRSYSFVMIKTGNMLYYYIICFACYIAALLITLGFAYTSNYDSMRFVAYFEFVALGINTLKRVAALVAGAIGHYHISRAYYVWIAIYIALALCFYFAKQKKKKSLKE